MGHVTRVLIECDTMLAETSRRYAHARYQLHQAAPGFPAHTPGAGEPGGGSGASTSSITERLADRNHVELAALERLTQGPRLIADQVSELARELNLPRPNPTPARHHVQLLAWSRWVIRRIIDTNIDPPSKPLGTLHRTISQLHRTVTAWAIEPAEPKARDTDRTMLADDLTGNWCRSCLRIGTRSPRHCGDLCRWCYDFQAAEGFLPPPDLLEIRTRGKVYDRDVEPFRRAHRDRTKRRRRRG